MVVEVVAREGGEAGGGDAGGCAGVGEARAGIVDVDAPGLVDDEGGGPARGEVPLDAEAEVGDVAENVAAARAEGVGAVDVRHPVAEADLGVVALLEEEVNRLTGLVNSAGGDARGGQGGNGRGKQVLHLFGPRREVYSPVALVKANSTKERSYANLNAKPEVDRDHPHSFLER